MKPADVLVLAVVSAVIALAALASITLLAMDGALSGEAVSTLMGTIIGIAAGVAGSLIKRPNGNGHSPPPSERLMEPATPPQGAPGPGAERFGRESDH